MNMKGLSVDYRDRLDILALQRIFAHVFKFRAASALANTDLLGIFKNIYYKLKYTIFRATLY